MTELQIANIALRNKQYVEAIRHYVLALKESPDLAHIIVPNLKISQKRYQIARKGADKSKVIVCGSNLANNAAGRALTLAQLYDGFADVSVIGNFFPKFGTSLWGPMAKTTIPVHGIVVEDQTSYMDLALSLVMENPCDILHLSKPRFPNILMGMLYKLVWGSRVIMDIDDEELGFVNASVTLSLTDVFEPSQGRSRPMSNLLDSTWTQLAVGLATAFDGVTVVNPALQQRYGGTIVRHARDEARFTPSAERREKSRKSLGIKSDEKVVLFLGTPRAHKGLMETAKAIASLKRNDIIYLIVGDFPKEIQSLKSELQSLNGVKLKFIPDQPFDSVPDILASADICVLLQDTKGLAARMQTPAKLSDALAMGVQVLASSTPGLIDMVEEGAVIPVAGDSLVTTLGKSLNELTTSTSHHPVFDKKLSFNVNRAVLRDLVTQTVGGELSADLLSLGSRDELGSFMRGLIGKRNNINGLDQGSHSALKKISDKQDFNISDYIERAEEASRSGDWSASYRNWVFACDNSPGDLSSSMLLRISRELFQLDAFKDSARVLDLASARDPDSSGVICEQARQYYYHCYSSWLMRVNENEVDWYAKDGLRSKPDWKTACEYLEKVEAVSPRLDMRRYVQAYLLLSDEARINNDKSLAISSFKIACKSIGPDKLDNDIVERLIAVFDACFFGKLNEKDLYLDSLQKTIKSISADQMSVEDWLLFSDVLNWIGALTAGCLARDIAIDRSIDLGSAPSANRDQLLRAFNASLERGNFESASGFLLQLRALKLDPVECQRYEACLNLCKGDVVGFRDKWPHSPWFPVDKLKEYFDGKSVAVVGPAPTGSKDGGEIDEFDVVVRMNWQGENSSIDCSDFGAKTNISIYNAHSIRLMGSSVAEHSHEIAKRQDFVFVRRDRFDIERILGSEAKVVKIYDYPCAFHKSLNAIQIVLFNLLLLGASRIKLFKADNYTGDLGHVAGYRPGSPEYSYVSLDVLHPVFGNHDLVTNLSFIKTLGVNSKVIELDRQAAQVFSRSNIDQAMAVMDNLSIAEFKLDASNAPSNPYFHLRQDDLKRRLSAIKKISVEKYEYAVRSLRRWVYLNSGECEKLRELKDIHLGKRCFIIGNGPSLKQQNLSHLKDEVTFVTNWFVNAEQYDQIDPKYYCVSSHEMFGGWNKPDPVLNEDFYKSMMAKAGNAIKFFSFAFSDYLKEQKMFGENDLRYLLFERPKNLVDEIDGFSLDLTRQLDDAYTVVLTMCVPLAIHMGIREIIFVGCDCDYGISSPDDKKKYFYDSSLHKTTTTKFENLQRIWGDNGPIFTAYDIVSRVANDCGAKLFNATHGGKLEVLPRVNYEDLFRSGYQIESKKTRMAFCTVLNDDFVPGFFVTLQSLLDKNQWFDFDYYIFYSDEYSPLSDRNKELILNIYPKVIFKPIDENKYGHIWHETKVRLNTPDRLKPAFFIIDAFSLYDYDRVVALDADLLILGDLTELIDIEAGFAACQAVDYDKKQNREFFNSGVMVINRPVLSPDVYNKLLSHQISKNYKRSFGKADQAILNDFFNMDDIFILPEHLNTTKRKYRDDWVLDAPAIASSDAVILHYVGEKPWVSVKSKPEEYQYSKAEYLWSQCFKNVSLRLLGVSCNLGLNSD